MILAKGFTPFKAFHIDFPKQVSSLLVFMKIYCIFEKFFRALRGNYHSAPRRKKRFALRCRQWSLMYISE